MNNDAELGASYGFGGGGGGGSSCGGDGGGGDGGGGCDDNGDSSYCGVLVIVFMLEMAVGWNLQFNVGMEVVEMVIVIRRMSIAGIWLGNIKDNGDKIVMIVMVVVVEQ